MGKLFLLLGSNMGDRRKNLERACVEIEKKIGSIKKKSSVYYTDPWGDPDQPFYFNQAVMVEAASGISRILAAVLQIEEQAGRERRKKWEQRILDIDIAFYDDTVISQDNLTIPHPLLHQRRFSLVPLAELEPGYIHPVIGKNIARLLSECPDMLLVRKAAADEG